MQQNMSQKQTVQFGNYMLSEQRKANFKQAYNAALQSGVPHPLPVAESLQHVHDADLEQLTLTSNN
ncbi:hypothetical protein [Pseudotamlana carrageenivorans]|uniref:Uncharacterized protein n=1 Tax=Pseudotamlana carrageenivorans TaxID=2069432 RepID=A0A2I7SF25_9FLAO|nr:hypothetical protein [Tamlana carrageenivorans]AUS04509.1 hypothetical protein C1A40_03035 [Tamlana carrageenivorans]